MIPLSAALAVFSVPFVGVTLVAVAVIALFLRFLRSL